MEARTTVRAGHYLLGVEGLAILRDFLGDPTKLEPRASDVAKIIGAMDEFPQSLTIPVSRYDIEEGYTRWAPRYDGPNPAIETEEPVFRELVAQAGKPGVALDAACGTGRHAVLLAAAGWNVIGVDATPAMLDRAREKLPEGSFRAGRLEALPVEKGSVDLVVCGLALTHAEDLTPVFAEFARVLRPGGQLITSDMHPVVTSTGGMAAFPTDEPGMSIHYVPNLVHEVSAYVTAMVSAGLSVLGCREPKVNEDLVATFPSYPAVPEATRQAFLGLPYLLIWHAAKPV